MEEEIGYGQEQLQLADHLLAKCNIVRKRGKGRERGSRRGATTRKRTKNTTGKSLLSSKK